MKLLLATKNQGKIKEINLLLKGLPIEVLTLDDFPGISLPKEDRSTFKGNALKKARFVAGETGLAAISDDSGLCVDALEGRPGVNSARYAGDNATDEKNREKLLLEMKDVPEGKRTASFVCVIALVLPSGKVTPFYKGAGFHDPCFAWVPRRSIATGSGGIKEKTFEGRLNGVIAAKPEGRGGFGYDQVFFLPGKGKTLAELGPEEKNLLSHRGAALRKLKKDLFPLI